MTKAILATRPEHDDTTHYLSSWCAKALHAARNKGITVFDLRRERAQREPLASILSKKQPELILLCGHGSDTAVCGHKDIPLIEAGVNEQLLRRTITFTISCRSARTLGPICVEKGARSFVGYDDDFVFFYDKHKITAPLEDGTAALFLEPPYELALALVKGNSVGESHRRSQEHFLRNMETLLSSEAGADEAALARYLWCDRSHQVFHGDGSAAF